MSEAATPATDAPKKKKKGKLPVILLLAVVLGTGGFFGMKMRGGGPQKEPEIKLGEIVPLEEFLLNLRDGRTYLRTEIALHFKEGFKKEGFDKSLPAVRDGVISVLTSQSLGVVSTMEGKEKLKAELATTINGILESLEPKPEVKKEHGKDKKETEGGKDKETADKAKDDAASKEPKHPDWQSQTGPVLKVYFTSFATQ
ncbi:MAG: hypothetical protein HONBIEJF_00471 [Fimbriimonadaceae bacterium]|nr:hypothetical protein [Fimbriimonadaceae bacterium]